MTDQECQKLAADWNALAKAIRRQQSSPCGDRFEIEKCEDRMARIEDKFRMADRDIRDWY